jgi:S1-C subfamily serine protease
MVTKNFFFALLGVTAILPARADGILEQMQTEVAAITARTRSAVVAVEDEQRKVVTWQFAPRVRENSAYSKRLQALQADQARLQAELAARDKELAELRSKYDAARSKDALAALDRATSTRRGLERRLSTVTQELRAFDQLARRQNLAAAERAALDEQLAEANERLSEMRQKLTETTARHSENHPTVQKQKDAIKLMENSIGEIKQRLAQTATSPPSETQMINILRSNSGTGFCIGDGLILTTADVVEPMENPVVVTDQGTRIKAKIVGVNGDLNIGLLQLQSASMELPALTLGDSEPVKPGHFAISIGNQTGDPNSVALNLVGGKREQGTPAGNRFYPSLIQIAGTVGAGTSGAPLMNAKGEVIGIIVAVPVVERRGVPLLEEMPFMGRLFTLPEVPNFPMPAPDHWDKFDKTAEQYAREVEKRFSEAGSPDVKKPGRNENKNDRVYGQAARNLFRNQISAYYQAAVPPAPPAVASAGFAVPINEIKPIIEQLRTGQVTRGWIGIAPEDEEQINEENGILNVTRRVRITGIFPESPAQAAGVQPGDILIQINGKPVRAANDVRETSLRLRPGDTLTLRIQRIDKKPDAAAANLTDKVVELKISPRPLQPKPAITLPTKKIEKL